MAVIKRTLHEYLTAVETELRDSCRGIETSNNLVCRMKSNQLTSYVHNTHHLAAGYIYGRGKSSPLINDPRLQCQHAASFFILMPTPQITKQVSLFCDAAVLQMHHRNKQPLQLHPLVNYGRFKERSEGQTHLNEGLNPENKNAFRASSNVEG